MSNQFRKWVAFGAGIGIEIGPRDLRVVAVRVRPGGIQLLGELVIESFAQRPADQWGAEYARFAKSAGASHLAAGVLLPRTDVIVRQLALPGVSARDLPAAIGYQIESLHPYAEDEAAFGWAPLGAGGNVLIGITRREIVERYAALFAEAGIRVGAVTFSAAAIYSSIRLLGAPPASGFLALHHSEDQMEAYGESPAHPVFSTLLDERATGQALAELRLPAGTELVEIAGILPQPKHPAELSPAALAYAAAVAAACPHLSLPMNLLPESQRAVNSRAMYIPTIVLGSLVVLSALGLWGYSNYEDAQYRKSLAAEIAKLEPKAGRAVTMDKAIETARRRTLLLDGFRKRTRSDLNAIAELTKILTPPTWATGMDLTRDTMRVGGETDQAAGLLKTVDASSLFKGSEFVMPIARAASGETYSISARRMGAGQ